MSLLIEELFDKLYSSKPKHRFQKFKRILNKYGVNYIDRNNNRFIFHLHLLNIDEITLMFEQDSILIANERLLYWKSLPKCSFDKFFLILTLIMKNNRLKNDFFYTRCRFYLNGYKNILATFKKYYYFWEPRLILVQNEFRRYKTLSSIILKQINNI